MSASIRESMASEVAKKFMRQFLFLITSYMWQAYYFIKKMKVCEPDQSLPEKKLKRSKVIKNLIKVCRTRSRTSLLAVKGP